MFQDQLALRVTLTRRDHPVVKLLVAENQIRKLTPREALLLAHGEDYMWGGKSGRRVRWMRPLRKPLLWQECYRTVGAPSIPVGQDWGRPDSWRDLGADEFDEICRTIQISLEGGNPEC